jgi:hypothetical protein
MCGKNSSIIYRSVFAHCVFDGVYFLGFNPLHVSAAPHFSSIETRVRVVSPNASWTHWNLHREVLISKTMLDELKSVLSTSPWKQWTASSPGRCNRTCLKGCAKRWGVSIKHFSCTPRYVGFPGRNYWQDLWNSAMKSEMFLDDKSDYARSLHNEAFVLKLTYLADIFSKLNRVCTYKERKEPIYLQLTTKFEVS